MADGGAVCIALQAAVTAGATLTHLTLCISSKILKKVGFIGGRYKKLRGCGSEVWIGKVLKIKGFYMCV